MNMMAANQGLHDMLDDAIEGYGYELVHLELVGREKSRVLRLYIDAPGGITLDDCVYVSQQVSRLLDVEDPFTSRYTLEVSSPGIERPLAKPEHFAEAVGQWVEVSTLTKIEGRKNFLGRLLKVEDDSFVVDTTDATYTINMSNVRRARLKPDLDESD